MATCIWEGCTVELPIRTHVGGSTYQPKYCDPHRLERAREAARSRVAHSDRKIISGGYVKILTKDGWRLEHHVVMEELLGRALLPEEEVRRKNDDRTDNSPENLVLYGPIDVI